LQNTDAENAAVCSERPGHSARRASTGFTDTARALVCVVPSASPNGRRSVMPTDLTPADSRSDAPTRVRVRPLSLHSSTLRMAPRPVAWPDGPAASQCPPGASDKSFSRAVLPLPIHRRKADWSENKMDCWRDHPFALSARLTPCSTRQLQAQYTGTPAASNPKPIRLFCG